ncbi:Dihydroflavonol-4-reductase [Drechslerella dactyloides]|uniref:Dihydroflavonol-4-reductase n=1 Tax=Drechslerella dactyloides TaxID=74499 RepID=A0AAD6J3S0_DREDA|nr:Dihydroflavonol-4-reductase [Drechslerella dactyloides]
MLITGATGMVGSAIVLKVLEAGYNVLLTVRKEDQIPWLKEVFKHDAQVKFATVPDFMKPGAFDEVVKGMDYIIHTASPIPRPDLEKPWKENYIEPAVKPTVELLEAALKEPKIKKVVITSSCISFVPLDRSLLGESRMASEASGNPSLDENADFGFPFGAYHASKIAGDLATWKFHDEKKPHYAMVTIHPDFIYGPLPVLKSVKAMEDHHTTTSILWREYHGIEGLLRFQATDHSVHVDDVADAHVKVLDDKVKDGERYILSAGEFQWDKLLEHAMEKYPEENFSLKPIPEWKAGFSALYFRLDASKAEKELGIKFKDINQQFDDLVEQMKKLPKEIPSHRHAGPSAIPNRLKKLMGMGSISNMPPCAYVLMNRYPVAISHSIVLSHTAARIHRPLTSRPTTACCTRIPTGCNARNTNASTPLRACMCAPEKCNTAEKMKGMNTRSSGLLTSSPSNPTLNSAASPCSLSTAIQIAEPPNTVRIAPRSSVSGVANGQSISSQMAITLANELRAREPCDLRAAAFQQRRLERGVEHPRVVVACARPVEALLPGRVRRVDGPRGVFEKVGERDLIAVGDDVEEVNALQQQTDGSGPGAKVDDGGGQVVAEEDGLNGDPDEYRDDDCREEFSDRRGFWQGPDNGESGDLEGDGDGEEEECLAGGGREVGEVVSRRTRVLLDVVGDQHGWRQARISREVQLDVFSYPDGSLAFRLLDGDGPYIAPRGSEEGKEIRGRPMMT